jgi:hypothetical protein
MVEEKDYVLVDITEGIKSSLMKASYEHEHLSGVVRYTLPKGLILHTMEEALEALPNLEGPSKRTKNCVGYLVGENLMLFHVPKYPQMIFIEWDFGDTPFEGLPYKEALVESELPSLVKVDAEIEDVANHLSDIYGYTLVGWTRV